MMQRWLHERSKQQPFNNIGEVIAAVQADQNSTSKPAEDQAAEDQAAQSPSHMP